MSNEIDNTVTLPRLASAIWNFRYRAAFVFAILMIATIAIYLVVPRKYGSEGKVFVQVGRGTVGIDPTATATGIINLHESRETEMKSIVEVMRSRDLAETVVDEIGAERILETQWQLPEFLSLSALRDTISGGGRSEDIEYVNLRRREKAVKTLQSNVKIDAEKKTTVISVWAAAQSPELARDIANAYLKNYQSKHLEINRNDRSFDFFDSQYHKQEMKVAQAQKAMSDYRSQNGVLSIQGARSLLQTKIDRLQLQKLEVETQTAAAEARVAAYDTQLAEMDQNIQIRSITGRRRSTELMRDRLSELNIEKLDLAAKLPPDHPKLLAIEASLKEAQDLYSQMPQDNDDVTNEINPNFLAVKVSRLNEAASLSGFQEQLKSLESNLAKAQVELEALNGKELVFEQLQRDIDTSSSAFLAYANKRAEAQVLNELDAMNISNVKVWQEAKLIFQHSSPRGSIVLPLGACFALIAALLVAFFSESRRMRKIDSVAIGRQLDLPVLVDIPRVAPSQTILN